MERRWCYVDDEHVELASRQQVIEYIRGLLSDLLHDELLTGDVGLSSLTVRDEAGKSATPPVNMQWID
ncbi:DUF6894 family protein [Phyllobacterium ifriqiyense]|uniref:DUF6894 family protein n=1 Tax=Phyllobacterium ifriqiyense TaxID=314238 RepID=UPI003F4907BA